MAEFNLATNRPVLSLTMLYVSLLRLVLIHAGNSDSTSLVTIGG